MNEEDDEEEDDEEEDDEDGKTCAVCNRNSQNCAVCDYEVEKKKEEEEDDDGDEELEVDEFHFENKTYYTEDNKNGFLYECLKDGEIGEIVGHLENGAVFFS